MFSQFLYRFYKHFFRVSFTISLCLFSFSSLAIETVLVTELQQESSTLFDIDSYETTSLIHSISRESFAYNISNLAEVLDKQAGIQIKQVGGFGTYSSAYVRGSSAKQTSIFIDGVLVNNEHSGSFNLSNISLNDVERIDIYPNNVPLQLSLSETGTAINIITLKSTKPSANITLGYGSLNTKKLAGVFTKQLSDNNILVSLEKLSTDNNYEFIDTNKTLFNSEDDFNATKNNDYITNYSALIKGDRTLFENHFLQFSIQGYNNENGISDAYNTSSNHAFLEAKNHRALVKYTTNRQFQTPLTLGAKFYYDRFDDTYNNIASNILSKKALYSYNTERQGINISAEYLLSNHTLLVSSEYVDTDYQNYNQLNPEENFNQQQYTAITGIQDTWQPNGLWTIQSAIKYFDIQRSGTELENSISSNLVYKQYGLNKSTHQLGARFTPTSDLQLSGNYSYGVRTPSLNEIYSRLGQQEPNFELVPELRKNYELGAQYSTELLDTEVITYYTKLQDGISMLRDQSGIAHHFNSNEVESKGIELRFSSSISSKISSSISLTFQNSQVTDSKIRALIDTDVPLIFDKTAYFNIQYKPGKWSLHADWIYEDDMFYGSAEINKADSRKQLNLSARVESNNLSVQFNVKNALNEHFAFYSWIPPTPGRTLFLTAKYSL